jgi:hypothetical protein
VRKEVKADQQDQLSCKSFLHTIERRENSFAQNKGNQQKELFCVNNRKTIEV